MSDSDDISEIAARLRYPGFAIGVSTDPYSFGEYGRINAKVPVKEARKKNRFVWFNGENLFKMLQRIETYLDEHPLENAHGN